MWELPDPTYATPKPATTQGNQTPLPPLQILLLHQAYSDMVSSGWDSTVFEMSSLQSAKHEAKQASAPLVFL